MVQRLHTTFTKLKIHTAKCDTCNQHNTSTMYRCADCGQQLCTPCWNNTFDGTHRFNSQSIILQQPRKVPTVRKKPVVGTHEQPQARKRKRIVIEDSSEDDDDAEAQQPPCSHSANPRKHARTNFGTPTTPEPRENTNRRLANAQAVPAAAPAQRHGLSKMRPPEVTTEANCSPKHPPSGYFLQSGCYIYPEYAPYSTFHSSFACYPAHVPHLGYGRVPNVLLIPNLTLRQLLLKLE